MCSHDSSILHGAAAVCCFFFCSLVLCNLSPHVCTESLFTVDNDSSFSQHSYKVFCCRSGVHLHISHQRKFISGTQYDNCVLQCMLIVEYYCLIEFPDVSASHFRLVQRKKAFVLFWFFFYPMMSCKNICLKACLQAILCSNTTFGQWGAGKSSSH